MCRSYLATCGYPWSLKLIDADTVDSEHWERGKGPVDIELTGEGRKVLGNFEGLQSVRYADGPLLGKAKDSGGLAPYTVLAYFRSDMAKNVPGGSCPTPRLLSPENAVMAVAMLSRPHPEYTETLRHDPRAVRWAAKHSPER